MSYQSDMMEQPLRAISRDGNLTTYEFVEPDAHCLAIIADIEALGNAEFAAEQLDLAIENIGRTITMRNVSAAQFAEMF